MEVVVVFDWYVVEVEVCGYFVNVVIGFEYYGLMVVVGQLVSYSKIYGVGVENGDVFVYDQNFRVMLLYLGLLKVVLMVCVKGVGFMLKIEGQLMILNLLWVISVCSCVVVNGGLWLNSVQVFSSRWNRWQGMCSSRVWVCVLCLIWWMMLMQLIFFRLVMLQC